MTIKNKDRDKYTHKVSDREVGDIFQTAQYWWDNTGKEIFRHRQFSDDMSNQQEAMDATNPLHPNYIGDSGIIKGYTWEMLTPAERIKVTIAKIVYGN